MPKGGTYASQSRDAGKATCLITMKENILMADGRYSRTEVPERAAALLSELLGHLRHNRTRMREQWIQRIIEGNLLTAMSQEEVFAETTSVYDSYLEVLETG